MSYLELNNIKKPLVVIPARGGSKGVPGKNIKLLSGKPLIQYTIEVARTIFRDDQICISSDSTEIIETAKSLGLNVPFVRPSELSMDESSTYDVLLHAMGDYEQRGYYPDALILLQATSPFRTKKHIQEAVSLYNESIDMIVSVKETKSNPYYVLFEENSEGWLEKSKKANFNRRQDCPKVWEYNGSIYVLNPAALKRQSHLTFKKVVKYEMDEFSSLDIDSEYDWKIAECMAANYSYKR